MADIPPRYLASGGDDSIVNLFDLSEWICARTITACEYVSRCATVTMVRYILISSGTSNAINALSFSHDGEFIAIANAGNYIDIVRLQADSKRRMQLTAS